MRALKKLLGVVALCALLFASAEAAAPHGGPVEWSQLVTATGTLNLATAPGCTVGAGETLAVRQATAACIQATTDYCATNGCIVVAPGGTYEIDSTAGITWSDSTKYTGFRWLGSKDTIIEQFHANAPILTIGDISSNGSLLIGSMAVDGMTLEYGVSQTGNTAAIELQFGNVAFSDFRNIKLGSGGSNVPYTALYFFTASGGAFFSNKLTNIEIYTAQESLFDFAEQGTGNQFDNVYMNNLVSGTRTALVNPFVMSSGGAILEQEFNRLNIEHLSASGGIIMNIAGATAQFNAFHMEDVSFTGSNPIGIYAQYSQLNFVSPTFYNEIFTSGNFTGTATMFTSYLQGSVDLISPSFYQNSSSPTGGMTLFASNGPTPPTYQQNPMNMTNAYFDSSWDGFLTIDATMPVATYGNIRAMSGYDYPVVFPAAKTAVLANPPTAFVVPGCLGQEITVVYDKVITGNLTLQLGANFMLSGSGSTTKVPIGHQVRVVRGNGATGAFTVIVKNSAGTTIGTFASGSNGTTQAFGFTGSTPEWNSSF